MHNQQFINGTWFEEEYSRRWYKTKYIDEDEPLWAKHYKDYYIGLMALYAGAKPDWRILDAGSGVGQAVNAWRRNGFDNIYGIEISETAVRHSLKYKMVCGAVQNLPYADKSFDLVSSFALLEHIDESIVNKVLKEFARVGRNQAHTIGMEAGSDPSHINIKSTAQWIVYIMNAIESDHYLTAALSDPLVNREPIFVAMLDKDITRPLWDWYENQKLMNMVIPNKGIE